MHRAISYNFNFYKPPTSAHNISIIEELAICQFCLLCALVRLRVELTCIRRTTDQQMMASTPETYPSSTSHVDFYDSGITTKGKTSQRRSVGWLRCLIQFFECRISHLWRNNSEFRESKLKVKLKTPEYKVSQAVNPVSITFQISSLIRGQKCASVTSNANLNHNVSYR